MGRSEAAGLKPGGAGAVPGAVAYRVKQAWTRNRPTGKIEVKLLVGGAEVSATSDRVAVRLAVAALGAASLGGTWATRLHEAEWLDEEVTNVCEAWRPHSGRSASQTLVARSSGGRPRCAGDRAGVAPGPRHR